MSSKFSLKDRVDLHASSSISSKDAIVGADNLGFTYTDLKTRCELLREPLGAVTGALLYALPSSISGIHQASLVVSLHYHEVATLVLPADFKYAETVRSFRKYPFSSLITTHDNLKRLEADGFVFVSKFVLGENIVLVNRNISTEKINFSWLLYTSGSTGESKPVMLSSENLNERVQDEIKLFKMLPEMRILNILPISHDLGLNQLLTSVWLGSTLEIFSKKLTADFAVRLTHAPQIAVTGMPEIWRNFIKVSAKLKLKPLEAYYITISGGSLNQDELSELRELFDSTPVYKTYGQTETFRSFAEVDQEQISKNHAGSVIEGVDVLLLSEDSKVVDEGELMHFGHCTMGGYWLDEELSNSKINLRDGKRGILTGDFFRKLKGNKYQFVGRKDDLVKLSGRRFHLTEIENCLLQSGLVKAVCVLKIEHDNREITNEELVAFVVSKGVDAEGFRSICLEKLERYKVPQRFILREEFPLLTNYKIDRRALLALVNS